jgi:SWI/SNF-related matrix-associated actin-dependent regulator of chromatin subfamily A-like protein 1
MPKENGTASMATNQAGERVIQITFPYDLDMVMNVRTLMGRKYHAEAKVWSAPLHEATLKRLLEWGFVLDSHLNEYLLRVEERKTKMIQQSIPGLKGELFPFQAIGVSFIEQHEGRVLIADEMGLGKTIQALAWLQMHPELKPVVIVVPASLKLNWLKEARAWITNPRIELLKGTTTWKPRGDILIINYDILWEWRKEIRAIQPKVLITDECHYYKSNNTKRTKAIKMVAKGIQHVIALSGTPIVNRPIEVYNAINIINPAIFPDRWHFAQRYCGAKHNGFGWDFSGASRASELHQILKDSVMIRRLKKDVLVELPDKLYSFIPLELKNISEYRSAQNDLIQFIKRTRGAKAADKAEKAEALVKIETLKQLAVSGIITQAIQWIEDFIEMDQKLVVFAIHKEVIKAIYEAFPKMSVKLDGSTPMSERQEVVNKFQNDSKIKLFIGNIQAAGVGITLTASSSVAFLELPWTPGALAQAIDRVHRIGQKDTVNVYYLFASGTIIDYMAEIINEKQKVLDAVLDGKKVDDVSVVSLLINKIIK